MEFRLKRKDNVHRTECIKCELKYQKQYRLKNKEKAKVYAEKWYSENKEKHNEYSRQYRLNHKEKMDAASRAWVKDNPERSKRSRKIRKQRRRAREHGKVVLWNQSVRDEVLKFWSNKCVYCGDKFKHMDHYIAISSPICPGTVPWNMVPACAFCNVSKGPKDPYMWIKDIHTISKIESGLADFRDKYEHNDLCK